MKKIISVALNRKSMVEIPTVPNFLKTEKETISIKDFSADELREIGKLWTENLIEESQSN